MKTKFFLTVVASLALALGLYTYSANPVNPAESLRIIYPNGGEILKKNTTVQIKWVSSANTPPNENVILVLYKKGIKHSVITKATPNNGRFPWRIPANVADGGDYRIRIRLVKNLSVNDFSDRNFSIKK
jgi:hypothetical protein